MATFISAILQNASQAVSTGKSIVVAAAPSVSISVSGTSTSFTIQFEASIDGTNWGKVACTKMLDGLTQANSTSVIGELWGFDIPAGIAQFRANLTAIANGNVTIIASTINA